MSVDFKGAMVVAIEHPDLSDEQIDELDSNGYIRLFGGEWLAYPLTNYPDSKGGGEVELSLDEISGLYERAKEVIKIMRNKFPDASEPTIHMICDHDAW